MAFSLKNQTFIIFLFILFFTGSSLAGENSGQGYFYTGLEYGSSAVDMKTTFIRDISGSVKEDRQFKNEYTTNTGGVFIGYTLTWKRAYLGLQGSFSAMDRSFELAAGSSRFVNEENYAYGLAIIPGVYLCRGISAFGKLGWLRGDFDFIKSSPTSTTYDVHTQLNGYTLGGGLAWDIVPKVTLKLGYEVSRYQTEDIRASLGVMNDATRVAPRSQTLFAGLQYNFR